MKKSVFFLLAAILLIGSASAAPVASPKPLSASQANEILEKISGSWTVDMTTWCPESKTFTRSTGEANINAAHLDNYTHEQYTVTHPFGTQLKGESFLRYNDDKNRFEVVQLDNSGKGVVVMVGAWLPEDRTLLFKQAEGQEQADKSNVGMQLRYIFLEDGTISKLTYKLNRVKKPYLASVVHYGNPVSARQ